MAAYDGIYIRQYITEIPNFSTRGGIWDQCIDIVTAPQPLDPSQLVTAPAAPGYCTAASPSYGYCSQFATGFGLNQANFVYVRAVNTTTSPITGRVWLYWAPSSTFMWPTTWQNAGVTVGNQMVNYQPLALAAAPSGSFAHPPVSAPSVTTMPFLVIPNVPLPNYDGFALIALIENQPSSPPTPPIPTEPFNSVGDIASWVSATPSVGWLDTVVQTSGPALQQTIWVSSGNGGQFTVAGAGYSLPTDGTMSLVCPGPDAANSVNISRIPVTNPNLQIGQNVTWPANFVTPISVSFWKGQTAPPVGASVRALLMQQVS
jgi:hypothetical protein